MRIAYVSTSAIPSPTANSVQVMKMCAAFAAAGHRTTLLVPGYRSTHPGVDDVYRYYAVDPAFDIRWLPYAPVHGWSHAFGLLSALAAKRMGSDLVFGRSLHCCYYAARFGLPVRYEAHADPSGAGPIRRRLFRGLTRHKRFERLIVISDALRRAMVTQGLVAPSLVSVARDAADHVTPGGPSLHLGGEGRLRVGYVGHFYAGKGIEMIGPLAEACPWGEFHVVGGTPAHLREWEPALARYANVFLHGFVPPSQTERFRQSVDVLIAPYGRSVESCGGGGDIAQWMSPLKLFEYMASGKAIVCSDLPVLREVVQPEVNGLLCEPGNVTAWSRALARLRDDAALRTRLGAQARTDFEVRHTWPQRAQSVLA